MRQRDQFYLEEYTDTGHVVTVMSPSESVLWFSIF